MSFDDTSRTFFLLLWTVSKSPVGMYYYIIIYTLSRAKKNLN